MFNLRLLSRWFDSENEQTTEDKEDALYKDIGFHSRAALKTAKARNANKLYGIWEDR